MAGPNLCEAPTGKTAKNFLEQNITLNGLQQTIRTDKGTAFTGNEFRENCKSLKIKLIYGTPYIHTSTGLVERGIRTLKEYFRTNLEEGYNINEALGRSLNVIRTKVQSSKKRNTVRKPLWQKTTKGNSKLFKYVTKQTLKCFSRTGDTTSLHIHQWERSLRPIGNESPKKTKRRRE